MSAAAVRPPAAVIELTALGKSYYRRKHKAFLVREVVNRLLRRRVEQEKFWALQEIDLSIVAGESVALVGRNGAGKSTLLGLVAGTVYPTLGTVAVTGRVGALLELGAGFHPDLTGAENIYLNASLLGLQKSQVDERYERIVAFSGLEEFIDAPLRTYSSGMQMRLGFSVAAHTDPDILLMDEVFAVGDQQFQHKCLERMAQFRAQRKTMLFVGHDLETLHGICGRAVWIEHGRIRADGSFEEVRRLYDEATS